MWANVVAHYMYYIATFSVRNSRNNLKYEISTDSDRKSFVLAIGKKARDRTFFPFLNQEKVDLCALYFSLLRLFRVNIS